MPLSIRSILIQKAIREMYPKNNRTIHPTQISNTSSLLGMMISIDVLKIKDRKMIDMLVMRPVMISP